MAIGTCSVAPLVSTQLSTCSPPPPAPAAALIVSWGSCARRSHFTDASTKVSVLTAHDDLPGMLDSPLDKPRLVLYVLIW